MNLPKTNRPGVILLCLCIFLLLQGIVQNGILSSSISSIEREFALSSAQSGSLASVYDGVLSVGCLPVGFLAPRGSMPTWLGTGFLVFGAGTLLIGLSVPFGIPDGMNAMGFLAFCQVLCGLGACTLFVISPVYLAENTTQRALSFTFGIFYACAGVAAAIGFVIGGFFVEQWTWWAGFIVFGGACLVASSMFLFLPDQIPREILEKNKGDNNTEKEDHVIPYFGQASALEGKSNKEILMLVWTSFTNVMTNATFVLNCLAASSKLFTVSALIVFLPKFAALSFGYDEFMAALLTGVTAVPGASGGLIFGGFLIKVLNASTKKAMLICIIAASITPFFSWVFLTTNNIVYFVFFVLLQFSSFSVESPLPTIMMRIVQPEDRGMTSGLLNVITRLLGAIPGPIVLGTFIDTTCLSDSEPCTEYNLPKLRRVFFLLTLIMTVISLILMVLQRIVWQLHLKRVKAKKHLEDQSTTNAKLTKPASQEMAEIKSEEAVDIKVVEGDELKISEEVQVEEEVPEEAKKEAPEPFDSDNMV